VSTGSDTYSYDDNDSRTRVNEANGAGSLDRYYCYDALNRLVSTRSASGCSSGLIETYTYDDAGNRTAAGSTTFSYDAQGQLSSCSPSCGTIAYDDTGRTSQWNGWYLTYDGHGRLASACKVSGCATGDMVTMRYDAAGRRVELVTRPNGGSATTTTFRYQGDALAQELTGTGTPTVVRTYVTDESGAIVKFCDPDCSGSNPQYLVTWNGHGDALATWKINADATLTLANSFTYSTWGQPTTSTHNSFVDLGFRFLYVGRYGVAWDNAFGLGLEYMSARHYTPTLGRFLQSDPARADGNVYAYVRNNPTTAVDPTGLCLGPVIVVCLWGIGDAIVGAGVALLAWGSSRVGVYWYEHPPRTITPVSPTPIYRPCGKYCAWLLAQTIKKQLDGLREAWHENQRRLREENNERVENHLRRNGQGIAVEINDLLKKKPWLREEGDPPPP
jgi:large repetitive protein